MWIRLLFDELDMTNFSTHRKSMPRMHLISEDHVHLDVSVILPASVRNCLGLSRAMTAIDHPFAVEPSDSYISLRAISVTVRRISGRSVVPRSSHVLLLPRIHNQDPSPCYPLSDARFRAIAPVSWLAVECSLNAVEKDPLYDSPRTSECPAGFRKERARSTS